MVRLAVPPVVEPKLFDPLWAVPFTRVLKLEEAVAEYDQMVFTLAAWLMLNVHSTYEPAVPLMTTVVPETVAPEEAVTSEPLIYRLPFDTVARLSAAVSPDAKSMLHPFKRSAAEMINSTTKTVFLFTLSLLFCR